MTTTAVRRVSDQGVGSLVSLALLGGDLSRRRRTACARVVRVRGLVAATALVMIDRCPVFGN